MAITKEMAMAELARRELAKRGRLSPEGQYIPAQPTPKPANQIMQGAMAGPAGLQPELADIPGMVTSSINGLLMGQPRTMLEFPTEGPVMANMKTGANIPNQLSSLLNLATQGRTPVLNENFKTSGMEQILPESVTPGGKAASALLELASGALSGGMIQSPKFQSLGKPPSKTDLISKAEKLTTEILQPPKADLQTAYEIGREYRPVKVAAKYISKAENYADLQSRLENVMNAKIKERNFLIKRYNKPIGKTYLQDLGDYITEQRRLNQIPDSELKVMQEVYDKELAWAKRQKKLNTVKAELRKEQLQKMTKNLMEKRMDGVDVSRDPARTRALDILRSALKGKIETAHPQIKLNNADWAALNEAKNLAAGQRALAQKAVPKNIIQKIISFIANPKDIPAEVARTAFDRQGSLSKVTARIEKLMRSVN